MVDHVVGLKCTICGQVYQPGEVDYVCPKHGSDGNLDVLYDYALIGERVKRDGLGSLPGMWRYRALLPVEADAALPPLVVGGTPLYPSPKVAEGLGLREVWFKDDGRNPTASLKDRASAVIVTRAKSEGRSIITTASTGNAAAALAGLAACMQIPTAIFVPATAPEAKVAQLLVYGSHVFLVKGTYDDAFDLCVKASAEYGWYCRNTGYNPYTAEGKKTVSYEICEQLAGQPGSFDAPDCIVVSVGDGNIISGVHKGLKDLLALGWISHMPRLIGVQAEGSSFMYQAWKSNTDPLTMKPVDAQTIADSISAGLPRDRVRALNTVNETDGAYLTVSDAEILKAIPALARATGIFAEPAASATYAGLIKAVREGILRREERVVGLITGNGLKDISSARKAVGQPYPVSPDMADVARVAHEVLGR